MKYVSGSMAEYLYCLNYHYLTSYRLYHFKNWSEDPPIPLFPGEVVAKLFQLVEQPKMTSADEFFKPYTP